MAFDPESGLTLTTTFSVNTEIDNSAVDRANSTVLAVDFTGLDGSSGGLIHEQGGSGAGSYIGFRPNGDFVARCADGRYLPSTGVGIIIVSAAGAPSGDGTLVVEFNESAGSGQWEVTAWWNGTELTGDVLSQVAGGSESNWAGTNPGQFLKFSDNLPQYEGYTNEVGTVVTYTTASGLRYYENQVVTATPSSDITVTGALFQNSNTFNASTVSASLTVAASRFDNAATFSSSNVNLSLTVSGQAYTDPDNFFAATLSGSLIIIAGLVPANNTFNASQINTPLTITGSLFQNSSTFNQSTVSQAGSGNTIGGSLFENSSTFYSSSISSVLQITGARHDNLPAFPQNTVSYSLEIGGDLFSDSDSFYAGNVTTSLTISGDLFSDADAFYTGILVDLGVTSHFYKEPGTTPLSGTLISPTRGGTLSKHEV